MQLHSCCCTHAASVADLCAPHGTQVATAAGLPLVCPPVRLCTDNGVMVAWTGQLRLRLGVFDRPLSLPDGVELHVEVRVCPLLPQS